MTLPGEIQGPILVRTPAKITPYLQVLRLRSDGYHEVRLALVPISLYDDLIIRSGRSGGIELRVEGRYELGPTAENLVYRAASAFQRETQPDVVEALPLGCDVGPLRLPLRDKANLLVGNELALAIGELERLHFRVPAASEEHLASIPRRTYCASLSFVC